MSGGTLNVILTHQDPARVSRMLDWWRKIVPADSIMIAYGGPADSFAAIEWRKVHVASSRLKTREHHKEMQSYIPVFRAVAQDGFASGYDTVHFAEYDQIPIQPGLNELQRAHLEREQADVLGYRLRRIDGTNDGHFLNHWRLPEFRQLLADISVRSDPSVVMSMLGFGSFWKAEAFASVCRIAEPAPFYLEVFLPSVTHHLGFRLRPVPDAPEYASHEARSFSPDDIAEAARRGQWNIHPLKSLWDAPPPPELQALLTPPGSR
jgi:hypothetical protein